MKPDVLEYVQLKLAGIATLATLRQPQDLATLRLVSECIVALTLDRVGQDAPTGCPICGRTETHVHGGDTQ